MPYQSSPLSIEIIILIFGVRVIIWMSAWFKEKFDADGRSATGLLKISHSQDHPFPLQNLGIPKIEHGFVIRMIKSSLGISTHACGNYVLPLAIWKELSTEKQVSKGDNCMNNINILESQNHSVAFRILLLVNCDIAVDEGHDTIAKLK